MNKDYYVAIMAGGIGSRFWPQSRVSKPKQFLDILHTGKTLIQWTFERFSAFIPNENIYVVTSDEYTTLVQEQLPTLPAENILSEPSRKNTAPCVAYISFKLYQKNPNACLIIAPSDHIILDIPEFIKIAQKALFFVAETPSIVTLGITPTYPNTGYGYIQHDSIKVDNNIFKVKTFTEKPSLAIAKTFLASGDFLWNAGIFVWKADTIVKAFEKYQPELYELFYGAMTLYNSAQEKNTIDKIYPLCTNISIDVAIMEKADNVYVIPASFGWSDLGTWNSAYEQMEKDYFGNAVASDNVIIIDATKCLVAAPSKKLVVVQGIDETIVVDTEDVLLIFKKEKEQELKEYVAEVKRSTGDTYL